MRFSPIRNGILREIATDGGFTHYPTFRHHDREVRAIVKQNLRTMIRAGLVVASGDRLALTAAGHLQRDRWLDRDLSCNFTGATP